MGQLHGTDLLRPVPARLCFQPLPAGENPVLTDGGCVGLHCKLMNPISSFPNGECFTIAFDSPYVPVLGPSLCLQVCPICSMLAGLSLSGAWRWALRIVLEDAEAPGKSLGSPSPCLTEPPTPSKEEMTALGGSQSEIRFLMKNYHLLE